ERRTKFAIGRPIPDLAQSLLGGIAERIVVVPVLRERRDAAGQRAAIGGKIHQRPWPPAERPPRILTFFREAPTRLRGRARRTERNAKRVREFFGPLEKVHVFFVHAFEQCLIWPRHSDRGLIEEDESL